MLLEYCCSRNSRTASNWWSLSSSAHAACRPWSNPRRLPRARSTARSAATPCCQPSPREAARWACGWWGRCPVRTVSSSTACSSSSSRHCRCDPATGPLWVTTCSITSVAITTLQIPFISAIPKSLISHACQFSAAYISPFLRRVHLEEQLTGFRELHEGWQSAALHDRWNGRASGQVASSWSTSTYNSYRTSAILSRSPQQRRHEYPFFLRVCSLQYGFHKLVFEQILFTLSRFHHESKELSNFWSSSNKEQILVSQKHNFVNSRNRYLLYACLHCVTLEGVLPAFLGSVLQLPVPCWRICASSLVSSSGAHGPLFTLSFSQQGALPIM